MNIGRAIKHLREKKGLSQQQLAKKSGVSQSTVAQTESGRRQPSKQSFTKICKGLKVQGVAVVVFAIEEKDIPANKKNIYKKLYPVLLKLAEELVK